MRIDRFVKVMLVLIAGLLLLNYAGSQGSLFKHLPLVEAPVEASTLPSFVQVGKRYNINPSHDWSAQIAGKVVAVDKEGWIQLESGEWINLEGVGILKEAR